MKIIEYTEKYMEEVKDLLVELQEYIIGLDDLGMQVMAKDYRDSYYEYVKENMVSNNGKMYLAIINNHAVGLIVGTLIKPDKIAELTVDNNILKGCIDELVIAKQIRGQGIGAKLMQKMEDYLKELGCQYIYIYVFGPNKSAQQFYSKSGYKLRNLEVIKKVK